MDDDPPASNYAMTGTARRRLRVQKRELGEWFESVEWEPRGSKREALDREAVVIATEEPILNIQGVKS